MALLVPPSVVTVTLCAPSEVLAVIVKVAVTVVSFTGVMLLTLTPLPDTVTPVVVSKLVPVRVTDTLVLRCPPTGEIEVSVGAGGLTTVNVTVLLLSVGVVMLTFLAVVLAPAAIAKVAVIVVSFTTLKPLTVMPLPETVTAVAVDRLVPVRVTGTL
jgi:hypothetical protein